MDIANLPELVKFILLMSETDLNFCMCSYLIHAVNPLCWFYLLCTETSCTGYVNAVIVHDLRLHKKNC